MEVYVAFQCTDCSSTIFRISKNIKFLRCKICKRNKYIFWDFHWNSLKKQERTQLIFWRKKELRLTNKMIPAPNLS